MSGARRLGVLALPLLLGFALALWRGLAPDPLSARLEDWLIDLRFQLRGARTPPDTVAIVGFDEAAIDLYGWSPPPRQVFAQAVTAILAADPAVLAIDILFLDPTDADAALADALADPRVVLATSVGREGATPVPPAAQMALDRSALTLLGSVGQGRGAGLYLPQERFLSAAALAHVNIVASPDKVARRLPVAVAAEGGRAVPSLALEAARRLLALPADAVVLRPGGALRLGPHEFPLTGETDLLMAPYGGAGHIATYPLADVVDGFVPDEALRGRAVFLGITAESLSDVFATSFAGEIPGVEVLATAAANLTTGAVPVEGRAALPATALAAATLAVAASLGVRVVPVLPMAALLVLVWGLGLALLQAAFAACGVVLDGVAVLAALGAGSLVGTWLRMHGDLRTTGRLRSERGNLARYVSPLLADSLARSATPDFDRRLQQAAVLFVDLAGYTGLSERLGAEAVAALLRRTHGLYEASALAHRGVVIGYAGDGAIVVFGLPRSLPDDAARALACGRALLAGGGALADPGEAPLVLRVSLHYGPVAVGLAGGGQQRQVSVEGDTVNVASRLQDVAKQHGAVLVASRALLDAAGGTVPGRPLGPVLLRGRSEPIEAWAL